MSLKEKFSTNVIDSLLDNLVIVAKANKIDVNKKSLVSGLPLENGVLTPRTFAYAADRLNLRNKIVKRSIEDLNPAMFPAILLLKDNSSCVVVGVTKDEVEVIFPEFPEVSSKLSFKKICDLYGGYTIYLKPEYSAKSSKSKIFSSSSKGHWFWSVISQNRRLYIDIVFAAIIINTIALAMPMFVMNVYDRVVPNNAFSTLGFLSVGILVLLGFDYLLKLLRSWFVDLAANRADVRLSSKILDQALSISMADRPQNSGQIAAMVQSFESVRSFVSSLTITALADLPFFFLFVLVVSLISLPLAIPIIVGSIIIIVYSLIVQPQIKRMSDSGMEMQSQRTTLLQESMANIETVKTFNIQSNIQARWEDATINIADNSSRMRLLSTTITNGAQWIQQTIGVSIIIIGVFLISEGDLSQGGLIAAYLISARAIAPVSQVAGIISQYHNAASAMRSLNVLMDLPSDKKDFKSKISKVDLKGRIELKNVTFLYPSVDKPIINDLSLLVNKGERVAIIGQNGAGKSTLEKLLLGLYSPKTGQVLVDDVDIKQLDASLIRQSIGYVPQDVSFLSDTLKQNLTNGKNFSDDEILEVLEEVGLLSMVQQHPDGILMPVGERGQLLSGGQKQALAIARALINNPSVLILDEPTASLDHASEEQIKNLLAKVVEERTLILITHRSPLLSLVDRIVVLDKGKILLDGPKEKVLKTLTGKSVKRGDS